MEKKDREPGIARWEHSPKTRPCGPYKEISLVTFVYHVDRNASRAIQIQWSGTSDIVERWDLT